MGLLDAYASGSDSDTDAPAVTKVPQKPAPSAVPRAAATSTTKVKKRNPVRITLDLPKTSDKAGESDGEAASGEEGGSGREDGPPLKKAKLESKGKGSSALLGMLPPPKRALPASATGKGGFKTAIAVPKSAGSETVADEADSDDDKPSGGLVSPSVSRNKGKGKLAAPAVDLFGLSVPSAPSAVPDLPTLAAVPPSVSSAPEVADYVPPDPTPNDPYPGFYQRPSGEWAAYDPEYYQSFFQTAESGKEDNRRGRDFEDLEGVDRDGLQTVDVASSLQKDQKEREEAKKLTAPKTFEDQKDYQVIKKVGRNGGRTHQLSSLIQMAHQNRQMMEEQIAANKRSSRAAGQKYGF